MDLKKIENLLRSLVFEDNLIAISILDNLTKEELTKWCVDYCEDCRQETLEGRGSSDFVFKDAGRSCKDYRQSYIVGKRAYYYLTGDSLVIDFPETFINYNKHRKISEVWK